MRRITIVRRDGSISGQNRRRNSGHRPQRSRGMLRTAPKVHSSGVASAIGPRGLRPRRPLRRRNHSPRQRRGHHARPAADRKQRGMPCIMPRSIAHVPSVQKTKRRRPSPPHAAIAAFFLTGARKIAASQPKQRSTHVDATTHATPSAPGTFFRNRRHSHGGRRAPCA